MNPSFAMASFSYWNLDPCWWYINQIRIKIQSKYFPRLLLLLLRRNEFKSRPGNRSNPLTILFQFHSKVRLSAPTLFLMHQINCAADSWLNRRGDESLGVVRCLWFTSSTCNLSPSFPPYFPLSLSRRRRRQSFDFSLAEYNEHLVRSLQRSGVVRCKTQYW